MAVLNGVKEKVHLPLYDSLFVRPRRQLRETETSSILKFFVNVQGKTRLETNLQAAGLLPHWNTFDARALRVVISDLPPQFPADIAAEIERCSDAAECAPPSPVRPRYDECLDLLRAFCDSQKMGPILEQHRKLRLLRADLATVIRRSKAKVYKPDALSQFADELDAMSDAADDLKFIKHLEEAGRCLGAIEQEIAAPAPPRPPRPPRPPGPARIPVLPPDEVLLCLKERLRDKFRIPLAEQLSGDGAGLFARLIFNSVTTFFVGEKVMIQMPTWFFPAGGGPYAGNGRVINHGFPAPEATFRFAEPVFIDAQQNFRVEMEIPDAGVLGELQRIYGPFFIWVTLDGYMQRDVQ
jgi:hypothetical protein